MIPMNFMRSKAGFTLVELIVVIAILAILAGVAIPTYSGYIKKANNAADMQVLSSVSTAVQGLDATSDKDVTAIKVEKNGNITLTPTDTGITPDAIKALTGTTLTFSKDFKEANWTKADGKWVITNN